MRIKIILLLIIFGMLPMLSLAYNVNFFEYAPDPWKSKRLITANINTPSQIFRTNQDAILTGFDFWLDNASDPGVITFTLANEEETVLAEKTISIPHISPLPGGKKFHVDLVSEVPLTKNSLYSIKMTSSILGLGLYYADRIASLEHNLPFTSEYHFGVAKFGSELQEITFKFALYRGIDTETGEELPPEEEGENDEEDSPITISITNARVAILTDTTALLTWTTDIAADSRVIIRTQLNPLYTICNVYDGTIELEHAILVEDLLPEANYFADVFSTQGNSIMLTTYTIGFQTLPQEETNQDEDQGNDEDEDETNQNEDQGNDEDENLPLNNPENNDPSTNDNGDSDSNTTSEDPEISINPGTRSNNTNIGWPAPADGEPNNGYRIDIFDYNYNLERTIEVPAGTYSKEVSHLGSGVHHVIIYENNDGVYTKVSDSKPFTLKTNFGSITFSIIGIALLWIISFVIYISWKIKKAKNVLPPEEGYNSGI